MRIVIYINKLGDGGAERVAANIANYLSETHDVTVINSFKYKDEYFLKGSITHLYTDKKHISNKIKRNKSRISFLRSFLINNNIDVAISFMAESNVRLLLAARGLKVKTIISVRSDPSKEYSGAFGKFIAKHILPKANGCVFQTDDAKKWFTKKLQKKSAVILNPVGDEFLKAECDGERQNIVTCGRLAEPKNHKLLIEAFSMICDKTDDQLIIYGTGSMLGELKEFADQHGISNRVAFPGNVNDVANKIKNAKIFVLSSDFEGMPNSLMEAMSLGLPCISTDCPCGGPKQIISNYENGILVPVKDKNKLADAIIELLNDDSLRCRIGSNARNYANKTFDSQKVLKQWESYILSLCSIDL